jgi:hypothetical protein
VFDLDMDVVRLERRVGVGGKRLIDLVLKPRDPTIAFLLIMRGPDTIDFRKRAMHASFRITAAGLRKGSALGTNIGQHQAIALTPE